MTDKRGTLETVSVESTCAVLRFLEDIDEVSLLRLSRMLLVGEETLLVTSEGREDTVPTWIVRSG